jgi:hypothetical protein
MVNLDLHKLQINRLKNGHNVTIKSHQIGSGFDVGNMSEASMKKLHKSLKTGASCRIHASDCDAGAGLFHDLSKSVKKTANKTVKQVGKEIKKQATVEKINKHLRQVGAPSLNEMVNQGINGVSQGLSLLPIPGAPIASQIASQYAQDNLSNKYLSKGSGFNEQLGEGFKEDVKKLATRAKKAIKQNVNVSNINRALQSVNAPDLQHISNQVIHHGAEYAKGRANEWLREPPVISGGGLDYVSDLGPYVLEPFNRSFRKKKVKGGSFRTT